MICRSCGNEIPDKVKFCPECGAKQGEGAGSEVGTILTVNEVAAPIVLTVGEGAPEAATPEAAAIPEAAKTPEAAEMPTAAEAPTAAEGGAQNNGAPYGAQNAGAPYGAQNNGAPYGAQNAGAPYGAQNAGAPYGAQNAGAHYGAQNSGVPYAPYGAPYAPYGAPYAPYGAPYAPVKADPYYGLSMKWHKFLTRFLLWAGAVINLILGLRTALGGQYGDSADAFYRAFPLMRTIDIPLGVLQTAMAVLGVITALMLIKLKKRGPRMLTILYAFSAFVSLLNGVYSLVFSVDPAGTVDAVRTLVISVGTAIAMIFVHRAYYAKRAKIFVN